MTIVLMFLALVALILVNVPIAIALGVVGIGGMLWSQGPDILPNIALVMYGGATSFPLLAIPLFILAGAIMNSSGISRRLVALASALLGFIRGGLSMVTVGSSMFFAEISGSAVADVAALGSVLIYHAVVTRRLGALALQLRAVTPAGSRECRALRRRAGWWSPSDSALARRAGCWPWRGRAGPARRRRTASC